MPATWNLILNSRKSWNTFKFEWLMMVSRYKCHVQPVVLTKLQCSANYNAPSHVHMSWTSKSAVRKGQLRGRESNSEVQPPLEPFQSISRLAWMLRNLCIHFLTSPMQNWSSFYQSFQGLTISYFSSQMALPWDPLARSIRNNRESLV